MLVSYMGTIQVLSASFPIQPRSNRLGKESEDGPRVWVPLIHAGDLDEAPAAGFSLSHCRLLWPSRPFHSSRWTLSLFFPLFLSVSQVKNKIVFKKYSFCFKLLQATLIIMLPTTTTIQL